jgi:glycine betaine/proline transport system ATP-binding protein
VAVLRDGRVLQVGTPRQLLLNPADEHVAAFVRDVNRARALRIGAAVLPWPAGVPLPPVENAVDADSPIEPVLARLVGRSTPLAVRRGGAIVGQVSMAAVREMLAAKD